MIGQALRQVASSAVDARNVTLVSALMPIHNRVRIMQKSVTLSPYCVLTVELPMGCAFKHHRSSSRQHHSSVGGAIFQDNSKTGLQICQAQPSVCMVFNSPASSAQCHYLFLIAILNIYCHQSHFAHLSGNSAAVLKAASFCLTQWDRRLGLQLRKGGG